MPQATSDAPSAYDFDFGFFSHLTRDNWDRILEHFTPEDEYAQLYPSAQRTFIFEIMGTNAVIQEARRTNCGHSVFDWANYLLEVNDFDEFLQTRDREFFDGDNNCEN